MNLEPGYSTFVFPTDIVQGELAVWTSYKQANRQSTAHNHKANCSQTIFHVWTPRKDSSLPLTNSTIHHPLPWPLWGWQHIVPPKGDSVTNKTENDCEVTMFLETSSIIIGGTLDSVYYFG